MVWNTAQLIHASLTWILNEQPWLTNVTCSTKIIKYSPHPSMNLLGTLQSKGCNLFAMSFMQGWRMKETKTERNLLPEFYWSISKIKYLGRISSAKVKHPTPGQFYLLSFPAWNKADLINAFKCWATSIIFQYFVCSNNFSNWVSFGYGRNICTQLYIANYLSALCAFLLRAT